jgi:hypothetical protein
MMGVFHLNCRRCGSPLIFEPSEGLTLHYRCREHGILVLRPLVEADFDDDEAARRSDGADPRGHYDADSHHRSW